MIIQKYTSRCKCKHCNFLPDVFCFHIRLHWPQEEMLAVLLISSVITEKLSFWQHCHRDYHVVDGSSLLRKHFSIGAASWISFRCFCTFRVTVAISGVIFSNTCQHMNQVGLGVLLSWILQGRHYKSVSLRLLLSELQHTS